MLERASFYIFYSPRDFVLSENWIFCFESRPVTMKLFKKNFIHISSVM